MTALHGNLPAFPEHPPSNAITVFGDRFHTTWFPKFVYFEIMLRHMCPLSYWISIARHYRIEDPVAAAPAAFSCGAFFKEPCQGCGHREGRCRLERRRVGNGTLMLILRVRC